MTHSHICRIQLYHVVPWIQPIWHPLPNLDTQAKLLVESLFLVVRPGAPSSFLFLLVRLGAPSSFLFLVVVVVVRPGAPSSVLFLAVRPGAPSYVLAPSSKARSP